MVGETTMNQCNGSTKSPSGGAAKDMGELTHDIVALVELQFELFRSDFRKGMKGLLVPVALLLFAGAAAVGTVPVALLFLAEFLMQVAGLTCAAAFSIAALGGLIVTAALGVAGWFQIRGMGRVFERSREELTLNMAWIKRVLKPRPPIERLSPHDH